MIEQIIISTLSTRGIESEEPKKQTLLVEPLSRRR